MKKLTEEEFLIKAKEIHGEKFSYEKVKYFNVRTKVRIICGIHGEFSQLPTNHIHMKQGCPACYGNKKLNNSTFIEKCVLIHGDRYDYSKSIYSGNKGKVEIVCKVHGSFLQTATRHLCGDGCPKCSESKGERSIRQFLEKESIKFISQKKFVDCKNVFELPFDFFIPEKNVLIEYDGQQHFGKSKGKKFDFDAIRRNDQIKTEYAKNKGIRLIRIPYTKLNKIEKILTEQL